MFIFFKGSGIYFVVDISYIWVEQMLSVVYSHYTYTLVDIKWDGDVSIPCQMDPVVFVSDALHLFAMFQSLIVRRTAISDLTEI